MRGWAKLYSHLSNPFLIHCLQCIVSRCVYSRTIDRTRIRLYSRFLTNYEIWNLKFEICLKILIWILKVESRYFEFEFVWIWILTLNLKFEFEFVRIWIWILKFEICILFLHIDIWILKFEIWILNFDIWNFKCETCLNFEIWNLNFEFILPYGAFLTYGKKS